MGRRLRPFGLLLAGALLVVTGAANAADPGELAEDGGFRRGRRSGVYIDVPAPDRMYDPRDLYFYGKKRLDLPGSIAVNVPPYVCDVDGHTFGDKTEFAAHLRIKHGELLGKIADPFIVHQGQVHFVGK